MNGKERRDYTRKHGKVAARKQYGNIMEQEDILTLDGDRIGSVYRYWHPTYTTWVHKAVLVTDKVYDYISFTGEKEAVDWARAKYAALKDPQFAKLLYTMIVEKTTVDQLAQDIGASRDVVYKWLRGDSVPAVHFLVSICKVLRPDEWANLHRNFCEMITLERA